MPSLSDSWSQPNLSHSRAATCTSCPPNLSLLGFQQSLLLAQRLTRCQVLIGAPSSTLPAPRSPLAKPAVKQRSPLHKAPSVTPQASPLDPGPASSHLLMFRSLLPHLHLLPGSISSSKPQTWRITLPGPWPFVFWSSNLISQLPPKCTCFQISGSLLTPWSLPGAPIPSSSI